MEKWKKIIVQGLICAGLLFMIWGGYYLIKHYGTDRILDVKEDDFSWVYQVDSVEIEDSKLVIQGFAFEVDRDAIEEMYEILLQDIETGEKIFGKMEYKQREDVNEYFLCEYDYSLSGFEATIQENKLNLKERSYEVLLRIKGKRITYSTGIYISGGNVTYANPMEFECLEVEGTDLEEITENGILRVYRPDYGIYVYQYEGDLYWIAEQDYGFVNGDTLIEYQAETTQTERLPEYRLENKWYWDNMGFGFIENELTGINTGKYRVAKKSIPREYAITKMWTGNYTDDWIWIQYFRPYYFIE